MRDWLFLLGGLLVWTLHFFLLYGIAEFGGSGGPARIAVLVVTVLCLLGDALLALILLRRPRPDAYAQWRTRSALTLALLGGVAIAWQALPVLFG